MKSSTDKIGIVYLFSNKLYAREGLHKYGYTQNPFQRKLIQSNSAPPTYPLKDEKKVRVLQKQVEKNADVLDLFLLPDLELQFSSRVEGFEKMLLVDVTESKLKNLAKEIFEKEHLLGNADALYSRLDAINKKLPRMKYGDPLPFKRQLYVKTHMPPSEGKGSPIVNHSRKA